MKKKYPQRRERGGHRAPLMARQEIGGEDDS